jgi:hypothetical protein
MGIFELLLVAGMALGGTGTLQAQPLLWIGGNLVRASGPVSLILLTRDAGPPPATAPPPPLSGPVGIIAPPPPTPGFAPPPPATPPPPPAPRKPHP